MTPAAFRLLRLLNDERPRAGAKLARELDLSVDELPALVTELVAHGVDVREEHGSHAIARSLDLLAPIDGVEILDQCESTNAVLLERAAQGARSGTAITCELQTAGRGRRGNRWRTGLADALTFSLLWRFDAPAQTISGLSLAVGVACVRALSALGIDGVALKWPNDLVHQRAKLGGILIELGASLPNAVTAVIGVGINVRLPAAAKADIDQAVTDLATISAASPARSVLLARLLSEMESVLDQFARAGFAAFRDEWLSHHAYQGCRVRLALNQQDGVEGIAYGIADDGALLVDTASGMQRFHSGDVSLRVAA